MFRDRREKRDDIVMNLFLDLQDALHREPGAFSDPVQVSVRHFAIAIHRFTGEDFDLQPDGKLALIGPNRAHFSSGVSRNHNFCFRRRIGGAPSHKQLHTEVICETGH